MSQDDWYRKTTWSENDQKEFFERLRRSRSTYNKAQYTRIQASYLQSVGTIEMIHNSLSLLDMLLQEWPEESELAMTYLQKAECYEKLNKIDFALESYRKCFEAQRDYKNAQTMAHLNFSVFVVEHELEELFLEANNILDEFSEELLFPIDIFIYCASKSVFYYNANELEKSKDFAEKAIEAASKTDSGFTYHKNKGLVKDISPKINEHLSRVLNLEKN